MRSSLFVQSLVGARSQLHILGDVLLVAALRLTSGSPSATVDLTPLLDLHAAAAFVIRAEFSGGLENVGLEERLFTSANRLPLPRLAAVVQVAHGGYAVLLPYLRMPAELTILGADEVSGATKFNSLYGHVFLL